MFLVFDLDDTLADTTHRQPILMQEFDTATEMWNSFFDACDKDTPIPAMIELLDTLSVSDHRVEIWTGRSDRVIEKTNTWLVEHTEHPLYYTLRMRPDGDFRPDTEIKGDWIEEYGKPDLVFEDRNKMAKWWREQGITCCQVRENIF